MIKEFKKLLTNNPSSQTRSGGVNFVTHQELGLVYSDIKDDIQRLDHKFSLEFVNVRKDILLLDEKLTGEIRKVREDSHRDLIEVKNELLERICGVEVDVSVLKSDVATLKSDVAVLKADVATLKSDVAVLKADVAELKSDVYLIKDYLFTKLASDIRTIVKECLAEQALVS